MLVGSLTQHAVRSCGHCGEMPLKIMLNVRDTQTRSGGRWVPLSTAKPIYCNTSERSINLHTNRRCHKSSLLLPAWQENTQCCIPTPPTSLPLTLQPPKNIDAAQTGEQSCCWRHNTHRASIPGANEQGRLVKTRSRQAIK